MAKGGSLPLKELPALDGSLDLRESVIAQDGMSGEQLAGLAKLIEQASGAPADVREVGADQVESVLREKHVIVPGCLNNSAVVEYFYFREMAFHDRVNPGPGEFIVRSMAAPTGARNVLFLGASDDAGQQAACEWLAEQIAEHGPGLPHLHHVHRLKPWPPTDESECALASALAPMDEHGRFMLNEFSHAALLYLYSADPDDGRRLRETALEMVRAGEAPPDSRRPSIKRADHYKAHRMVLYWQLLEHLPLFSEQDRVEIVNALLGHYYCYESAECLAECEKDLGAPGNRHLMTRALDTFVEADYFRRRLPELDDWDSVIRQIKRYFEPIWSSSKGGGLIEGYGSYLSVAMEAALLMGRAEVLRQEPIGLWCERLIALCTNMGVMAPAQQTGSETYPIHALAIAAYMLGDGRFEYVRRMRARARRLGVTDRHGFTASRLFPSVEPVVPEEHTGMKVLPLEESYRRLYAPQVDPQRGFDTLSARSGFDFEDEYFLVQGLRCGYKYSPIVGALTGYQRFGYHMIRDTVNGIVPRLAQIRSANVLGIMRDGEGVDEPPGAEMLSCENSGDAWQAVLVVRDYNGADWYRTLHWLPGRFLLIRDTVTATRPGEYRISNYWNVNGVPAASGRVRTYRFERGDCPPAFLHLEVVGHARGKANPIELPSPAGLWPAGSLDVEQLCEVPDNSRPDNLELSTTVTLQPGSCWTGYTLIHATQPGEVPAHTIDTFDARGATVSGRAISLEVVPGEAIAAAPAGDTERTEGALGDYRPASARSYDVPGPVDHLAVDECLCVACGSELSIFNEKLSGISVEMPAPVSALSVGAGRVCAATSQGGLTVFDLSGQELWRRKLPILDEVRPYYWWVWQTPLATALHVGPLGPEPRPMIVAGSASSSLIAFDLSGEQLWHVLSGWGSVRVLQTVDWDAANGRCLLVARAGFSCSGRVDIVNYKGETLAMFEAVGQDEGIRRGVVGWDICDAPFVQVLEDGSRRTLILCRSGSFCNLAAYNLTDKEPLWCTDVGRYATGFASGGESGLLAVGTEQELIVVYDTQGHKQWHRWLDRPISGLAALGEGRWLVGQSDRVFCLDAGGRPFASAPGRFIAARDKSLFIQNDLALEEWHVG